jgi:hypothetical protein
VLTSREQCAVQLDWSFTFSSSLRVSAKATFGLPSVYSAVEGVQRWSREMQLFPFG